MSKRTDKRKAWITAAELNAKLAADPEYQAMMRAKEEEWARRRAMLDADQESLVRELAEAGVRVEGGVWDLVNRDEPYPAAIPVLVAHLSKPHHERIREGIIRALTVPEARGAATGLLIDEFRRARDNDYRWVVGNALAMTTTAEHVRDLVPLMREKRFRHSREALPRVLALLPPEEAEPILAELVQDPDTSKEAKRVLKRIRKRKGKAGRPETGPAHGTAMALDEWEGVADRAKLEAAGLVECSTALDAEQLRPFLERVAGLVDEGFSGPEIDGIMHMVKGLGVGEQRELICNVVYGGVPSVVHTIVFLDDVEAADVSFFCSPPLAEAIAREMQRFFDELGI